ncbi:MAG: dGTPase [Alphaproteobacteria bacterium]|nr:dGTPase [Alphaproteobacteria bacterium]
MSAEATERSFARAGPGLFAERRFEEPSRVGDVRDPFDHDKGRVIHSAAFRRLQGKTQVMATGEGDFHRTRLTHSIEVGQIGEGLLLKTRHGPIDPDLVRWLPPSSLLMAACHAHDLGHPPYGHSGEISLNVKMAGDGGFEGNGQTLRVITRIEKYRRPGIGLNPTRRLILAVLKYPVSYNTCIVAIEAAGGEPDERPPKCYLDSEAGIVDWALEPFSASDRARFVALGADARPLHRNFDCSLMECADDIAYAVHDLEDVIARGLIRREWFEHALATSDLVADFDTTHAVALGMNRAGLADALFSGSSFDRKQAIAGLVNLLVTNVAIRADDGFEHPLLRYNAVFEPITGRLVEFLKGFVRHTVIESASVRQLRRKGDMVIQNLFDELCADHSLIPENAWADLSHDDGGAWGDERRVCDFIAGMTDAYAERLYRRLFEPGYGTTTDEL